MSAGDDRTIALAERILNILDEGTFTATYKYAVLIGLIDLCIENTSKGLVPPQSVTTRQLAWKVLELYWAHAVPFRVGKNEIFLKQNQQKQATVVNLIKDFRDAIGISTTLTEAISGDLCEVERLVKGIERVLIEQPLPRLQIMGASEDRFLYNISWKRDDVDTRMCKSSAVRKEISKYLKGVDDNFDNIIRFMPGIPELLVRLNGLLRPLLQRSWASMVAKMNALEESKLESFLFGINREALGKLRPYLCELQRNRCFYCQGRLGKDVEVDHFIPWSRYPNNEIYNLVAADKKCNGWKSYHIASAEHLEKWFARYREASGEMTAITDIAKRFTWEIEPSKSRSIASSVYSGLSENYMLWREGNKGFIKNDRNRIISIIGSVEL